MCNWKCLSRPLEVIVSDMTVFYVKGKYYELTFILMLSQKKFLVVLWLLEKEIQNNIMMDLKMY